MYKAFVELANGKEIVGIEEWDTPEEAMQVAKSVAWCLIANEKADVLCFGSRKVG